MSLTIRPPNVDDINPCGRIMYEAFSMINERHGFPNLEVPTEESGKQFVKFYIKNRHYYGVVAELDNKVVGSIFIDEHNPEVFGWTIMGVSQDAQGKGIGKRLSQEMVERCKIAPGVRFLQHTFNTKTIGIYTSLGYDVRELVALLSGKPKTEIPSNVEIRRMSVQDLDECAHLCKKNYGFDRNAELRDALIFFKPFVILRENRITGYISAADNWGQNHGVAETEEDMKMLIGGVSSIMSDNLTFLLPFKHSNLLRWCLKEGFRIVKPFTLMSTGRYIEPRGIYITSVIY
jgi:GNAT superfamily N-acetyltransferase